MKRERSNRRRLIEDAEDRETEMKGEAYIERDSKRQSILFYSWTLSWPVLDVTSNTTRQLPFVLTLHHITSHLSYSAERSSLTMWFWKRHPMTSSDLTTEKVSDLPESISHITQHSPLLSAWRLLWHVVVWCIFGHLTLASHRIACQECLTILQSLI